MIDVSAHGGREPRHVPERAGDAWNRMVTVVPCPGALVRPMVPPQLSTSRRAMASPRPDPLDVVENAGSKTRGSTSGAIPRPSSSTASPDPPSEMRTVTLGGAEAEAAVALAGAAGAGASAPRDGVKEVLVHRRGMARDAGARGGAGGHSGGGAGL